MTDELDQLTDEELDELVAVEVAGSPPSHHGGMIRFSPRPRYSTSADAVLPLLKTLSKDIIGVPGKWWVRIQKSGDEASKSALATTFARAACLALLRHARATKAKA